jgi:hypothetical protein
METDPRMETIRKIFDETRWITFEALLASHPGPYLAEVDPVTDWKRRGLIFGITIDGIEHFPRYQFDATGCPLPVIREILEALWPVGEPWKIAAWFHFPKGWLVDINSNEEVARPMAPKDALQRPADVIKAARNWRGTYAA